MRAFHNISRFFTTFHFAVCPQVKSRRATVGTTAWEFFEGDGPERTAGSREGTPLAGRLGSAAGRAIGAPTEGWFPSGFQSEGSVP